MSRRGSITGPSFFGAWSEAERSDTCARKHGGNPESEAAHDRAMLGKSEAYATILRMAGDAGAKGVTMLEVAAAMGKTPNSISGRFTELSAARRIIRNGLRRDGSAAWVLSGEG